MIYYETEKKLRKEVLDYIKTQGNFAKSTISTYLTDSFNVLDNDKGIDFWEMLGDDILSNYAKKTLESSWITWTNLHSRHVKVNNHHNYLMGVDRINDFVAKYPQWIDIVRKQSQEVNNYLYSRCEEEFATGFNQDKINLLVDEFKEKFGPYDEETYEGRIITYLYIKGFMPIVDLNYRYRIYTDMMQITLLNMDSDKLGNAIERLKDSIIKFEYYHYYKYEYRRKWLKELAVENNIEIDLSDSIFKAGIREAIHYSPKDLWSITDKIDDARKDEIITFNNYDESLYERIANIPEGNCVFALSNITIAEDDQYFREFNKGMLITGLYEVVKNYQDGKTLDLKLINNDEKIWYHDTFPNNFSYFTYNNWKNIAIIDLILEEKPQDMQLYIEKYGKSKDFSEIKDNEVIREEVKQSFSEDLFMDDQEIDELKRLILKKKNVILKGAPGVGKTFSAKRLAYSIMGGKDDSKVAQIQFHQSYSYEDLVMGYRPVETGFELKTGPFYDFCKVAAEDLDHEYFFIIDEINRGNISKIFGELLMLIEADKRGPSHSISLLYNDEQFNVPENLIIIGMMNTADRSLAMIDYAFRRRFAFYELKPAFDNNKFKEMLKNTKSYELGQLVEVLKELNKEIINDTSLGRGFVIGHSYVTKNNIIKENEVNSIIKYEILPLLEEYWFDDEDKFSKWSSKLMGI